MGLEAIRPVVDDPFPFNITRDGSLPAFKPAPLSHLHRLTMIHLHFTVKPYL